MSESKKSDGSYTISLGLGRRSQQLTRAQKSSSLFSEEPVVLGKVLRRGMPPRKITAEQFEANKIKLTRLAEAGSIIITEPDATTLDKRERAAILSDYAKLQQELTDRLEKAFPDAKRNLPLGMSNEEFVTKVTAEMKAFASASKAHADVAEEAEKSFLASMKAQEEMSKLQAEADAKLKAEEAQKAAEAAAQNPAGDATTTAPVSEAAPAEAVVETVAPVPPAVTEVVLTEVPADKVVESTTPAPSPTAPTSSPEKKGKSRIKKD